MREFISDDRVSAFVCAKTGLAVTPGQYTQLGILQDSAVSCGFVFTHYTGHDVALTLAVAHPRALSKTFLIRSGHYLFDELSVARVTMLTQQRRVVDIATRLGAVIEGVKRSAFGVGRDAIMLGLLAKDWKFRSKAQTHFGPLSLNKGS